MKIGIITFHWASNYGAILQTYALQQYIKSIGHEVDIINYKPEKFDFSWFSILRHPKNLKRIKQILNQRKKESKLVLFRNKYLNTTNRYRSYTELKDANIEYDVLISGSDQILNPSFTMLGENKPTPSYYLSFTKKDTLKIGYAVSFGCTTYPEFAKKTATEWINNFDKIGVRELTGLDILKDLKYNGFAEIVPDPTILYGTKMFQNIEIAIPPIKDYTCIYMLRKKLDINIKNTYTIDEQTNPVTMEEWLGYISHSKNLITNSYHGTIIAILFHRPFVAVLENNNDKGMNDRFITLLNILKLQNRIADSEEKIHCILKEPINWEDVDNNILKYSKIGKDFLTLQI